MLPRRREVEPVESLRRGRRSHALLTSAGLAWLSTLAPWSEAHGQSSEATPSPAPFQIVDNSFFMEEAFNQEPGVFQNILGFVSSEDGTWEVAFTQEWPAGTQRHQISYTVPLAGGPGPSGIGDVLIHYRFQALTETAARPAFAPRLSFILPTGDEDDGLGTGHVGVQTNFPLSKQVGDVYLHWNAGLTYQRQEGLDLWTPNVGTSAIWRVFPMLNLMLETVLHFQEVPAGPGSTIRETVWFLSPGVRGGWNLGDHQLVVGAALPLALTDAADDLAFFGYLSYELPFRR